MTKSKTMIVSWVAFASLVMVLGVMGWLSGMRPPHVAEATGLLDDTIADFSAGSGCFVSPSSSDGLDGEVILTPTVFSDFPGTSLPAGWATDGGGTVNNGILIVNEGTAGTGGTYGPYGTLEFESTMAASPFQLAGLGVSFYAAAPYAIFNATSTGLSVRTNAGSADTSTDLAGSYVDTPHRYRIEWLPTQVEYFIDDTAVATHSVAIAQPMSPLFQDSNGLGITLTVKWMRMSDYGPSPCTFTSQLIDSGIDGSTYTGISTTVVTPAGTAIAFEVITSTDNLNWGAWTAVNPDGTFNVGVARYMQYRATLSTTDAHYTPEIRSVRAHGFGPPPTAVQVAALSATGTDLETRGLLIGLSGSVLVLTTMLVILRKRQ